MWIGDSCDGSVGPYAFLPEMVLVFTTVKIMCYMLYVLQCGVMYDIDISIQLILYGCLVRIQCDKAVMFDFVQWSFRWMHGSWQNVKRA